jgi:dihydrofolate reductase
LLNQCKSSRREKPPKTKEKVQVSNGYIESVNNRQKEGQDIAMIGPKEVART